MKKKGTTSAIAGGDGRVYRETEPTRFDVDPEDEAPPEECSRCGGSGGGPDRALKCPACGGSGKSREFAAYEEDLRAEYLADYGDEDADLEGLF